MFSDKRLLRLSNCILNHKIDLICIIQTYFAKYYIFVIQKHEIQSFTKENKIKFSLPSHHLTFWVTAVYTTLSFCFHRNANREVLLIQKYDLELIIEFNYFLGFLHQIFKTNFYCFNYNDQRSLFINHYKSVSFFQLKKVA